MVGVTDLPASIIPDAVALFGSAARGDATSEPGPDDQDF